MTDRDILLDLLRGTRCACTGPKKPRMSFCRGCYGRLPEGLQRALYHREDYPAAYRRALDPPRPCSRITTMNMTKEQRAELRELKSRLRMARGEKARVLARIDRAEKAAAKRYIQARRKLERILTSEAKALGKERRAEEKHEAKVTKALLARIAVLEGRLAS